jgi:hypothetical protein
MTVLRFPLDVAVGEVRWEDAREPNGWGHRLAMGVVEVPDGTAVTLSVYAVEEVSVFDQAAGGWRVTWKRGMRRNTASIWGQGTYSFSSGEEPVDLGFISSLPSDSISDLTAWNVVPASFAAVGHLAPGLRSLNVYLDNLGDDAPSAIAELTALESLAIFADSAPDEGRRLDDRALSAIADLPALQYLALLGGAYTERGLWQLVRLPKLRHLHIEREGLTAPMFGFAAAMPALTSLTGLDEFGDDGPMPPEEVQTVRAMLPHLSPDPPA